jgi:hypothetical protein
MIAIRQYSILLCVLITSLTSLAQNPRDPNLKPERNRELFHDYVDAEQKKALSSDGKDDKLFSPSANEETNIQVTNALITKVNEIQRKIEKDS